MVRKGCTKEEKENLKKKRTARMTDLTFSQRELCVQEASPKHILALLYGCCFKGFTFLNIYLGMDIYTLL